MIILVTGGRDYAKGWRVRRELREYAEPGNILIQGGANGADTLAHQVWTRDYQLPSVTVPAPWDDHGKVAGQMRNHQMVVGNSLAPHAVLEPDVVLAFPGGRGTAHCVERARYYNIEVREVG